MLLALHVLRVMVSIRTPSYLLMRLSISITRCVSSIISSIGTGCVFVFMRVHEVEQVKRRLWVQLLAIVKHAVTTCSHAISSIVTLELPSRGLNLLSLRMLLSLGLCWMHDRISHRHGDRVVNDRVLVKRLRRVVFEEVTWHWLKKFNDFGACSFIFEYHSHFVVEFSVLEKPLEEKVMLFAQGFNQFLQHL